MAHDDHRISRSASPATDHHSSTAPSSSSASSAGPGATRDPEESTGDGNAAGSSSLSGPGRSRATGAGHEVSYVQPASYLRPRGLSHPMAPLHPDRAIDREEQMGLVSLISRVIPNKLFTLGFVMAQAPSRGCGGGLVIAATSFPAIPARSTCGHLR